MEQLKIGIVGAGGIATDRHIPTFQQFQEVSVSHIYDIDAEKAKIVATEFGIEYVCDTYEEMLEAVDAVIITTPNKFHAPYTIQALNRDVHVMCEKPMALSSEECDAMIEAEERSEGVLHIAYHYRFMKEAIAAKQIIGQGIIGEPLVINIKAMRRRKVPGWGVFTNKELQGGGSLIDYGCHLLDLAMWLAGDVKPIEVNGTTYNRLSKDNHDIVNEWGNFDASTFEVDDHVTAYVKFDNQASMLFETSWAANIEHDEEFISIAGTKGGINVFDMKYNTASEGLMTTTTIDYVQEKNTFEYLQASNFIRTILHDSVLKVKSVEARNVSKIIEAIYLSSAQNKAIKIQNS